MYTFQAHIVCYDVNIPVEKLILCCIELPFYSYNMYIRITNYILDIYFQIRAIIK